MYLILRTALYAVVSRCLNLLQPVGRSCYTTWRKRALFTLWKPLLPYFWTFIKLFNTSKQCQGERHHMMVTFQCPLSQAGTSSKLCNQNGISMMDLSCKKAVRARGCVRKFRDPPRPQFVMQYPVGSIKSLRGSVQDAGF
jgi:hypothetical protein